jgi:protein TonB
VNRLRYKWAAALSLSVLIHAGAAAFVARSGEEVRIEGGQQVGVIVLGNAFEDMIAAGEPAETAEASQPEVTLAEPIEAETVREQPAIVLPDPSEIVEVDTADPVSPTSAQAVESDPAAVATDTAPAVEPSPSMATTLEAEPVEPVQTEDVVVALAPVPVPTPRPAYTAPPPKTAAAPPAKPQPRRAAKQTAQPGSRGENARDAKQGSSNAGSSSNEGATRRSERRTVSAAGNAAVSSYPGKIVSKLRRSLRYPAEAKRNRLTGEVQVAFVVSANGAAESMRRDYRGIARRVRHDEISLGPAS